MTNDRGGCPLHDVHPVDSRIHVVASEQHGTFSRAQARAAGASPNLVRSRVDQGRWQVLAPGVLGLPGHRSSLRRDLWVAVLHGGDGAAVTHEAAGVVRGMEGVRVGRLTISVPRARSHPLPGVTWHRVSDLEPADVTTIEGLPVTTTVRTLLDLAAVVGQPVLDHLVEGEVVARRTTVAAIGERFDRLRRRGKPSVLRMATTLDRLGPGDGLSRTELEALLDRVIRLAGLPTPIHEHPLPAERGMRGFVDRWFPEAKLVVEGDGRRWHERRAAMARDRERDIELARHGIQTLRFVWERLSNSAAESAEDLAVIHAARVALLAQKR